MTKFEEEVKRPANGPLTELNNNMQEVFSQYRKMRQYADYLEYELKQKDEHILKVENENSFMRDERTTFDSNGMAVEPKLQHQALPVVPQDVVDWVDNSREYDYEFEEWFDSNNQSDVVLHWLNCENKRYAELNALALAILIVNGRDAVAVEKPQLFYLKNKLTGLWLMRDEVDKVYPYDHTTYIGHRDKFTQEEIDSMQTGSYEQIKVTE